MLNNYPAGVSDKDFDQPRMTEWSPCPCKKCDREVLTDENALCEKCFEPEAIEPEECPNE